MEKKPEDLRTWPLPRQRGQTDFPLPLSAPVPLQASQVSWRVKAISSFLPKAASRKPMDRS